MKLLRRGIQLVAAVLGVSAVILAGVGAIRALKSAEAFRIRTVVVRGAVLLDPEELADSLNLPDSLSVFDDLSLYGARLLRHPAVAGVKVARQLPATLVVKIREEEPVLLSDSAGVLLPITAQGSWVRGVAPETLPELPVLVRPATARERAAAGGALAGLRRLDQALWNDVEEVQAITGGARLKIEGREYDVILPEVLGASHLARLAAAERILALRPFRTAIREIDLRFEEQAILRR